MPITVDSQSGGGKTWKQVSLSSDQPPAWLGSFLAVCEQRDLGISREEYCSMHKIPFPDFLEWEAAYALFYKRLTVSLWDSVIYSPGMILGVALMRGILPETGYRAMLQVRILLERIELTETTNLGEALISATTAYGAPGREWKNIVDVYINPKQGGSTRGTKKSMGRPLKYTWLAEYIEEDVLYSPAGLVDAAQKKGHLLFAKLPEAELKVLRVNIRHTLAKLIKVRGFESDGEVSYYGQPKLKAYVGWKWIKALKPRG